MHTFTRDLGRGLVLALSVMVAIPWQVFADSAAVDNDVASPGNQNVLSLTAPAGSTVNTGGTLVVEFSGSRHLVAGSSVTIDLDSTSLPTGATVASVTGTVPTGWSSGKSFSLVSAISFTAPATYGLHTYTVKWKPGAHTCASAPPPACFNVTSALTINLTVPDTTPPTISASATKTGGAAYTAGSWTNQNVTVTFTCADAQSGVASCTSPVSLTSTTALVSGTATDNAGNSASASFGPVSIDKTPPTISASAFTSSGAYTAGTWVNRDVTVHFDCADTGGSGLASCTSDVLLGATTASTSGTATDNAGNSASTSFGPVNIDKAKPTITATATKTDGTPYLSGTWTNQAVRVQFACADTGGSGLLSGCPGDQVFSAQGSHTSSGATVSDAAGNQSDPAAVFSVLIDRTAPTISAAATKADSTTYTSDTWTNQSVTVQFTCADTGGSGLAGACPANEVYALDGTYTSGAPTVSDNAGNISAPANTFTVKVDKTPPAVTATPSNGADGTNDWYRSGFTAGFSATDALSGVAACDADAASGADTAAGSLSGSCTDNAGNIGTATFTYKLDTTAPTIVASATRTGGGAYTAGDWTNDDVTVTFTCGDATSGVASCPAPVVVSASTLAVSGTATDNAGNSASTSFGPINIDRTAPTISAAATKADSTTYTSDTWTNQSVTVQFTCADTGGSGLAGACPANEVYALDGTYTSGAPTVSDNAGNISAPANTFTVKVDKTPPAVTAITLTGAAGPGVVAAGSAVSLAATASDALSGVAEHRWTVDGAPIPGAGATNTYTPAASDVLNVCVVAVDRAGNASAPMCSLLAVYDPTAGFVTGGGWIDSPAGALAGTSVTGRASFGFVSKYQKGATTPTGNTEFQFKAGGLNFHSTSYQWLVVSGARAQFKGTGTVNGVAGYSFLLTATDSQVNGGGNADRFRIKVWNSSGVVYDNMLGASDDLDPANAQVIGGGSIVIHSQK